MKEVRRQFERHPCDTEVGVIGNNGEAVIYLILPVSSVAGLLESGSELLTG